MRSVAINLKQCQEIGVPMSHVPEILVHFLPIHEQLLLQIEIYALNKKENG